MSILSLLILFVLIRNQFGFERPSRLRYLLIPGYSLIMMIVTFKMNTTNLIAVVIILLVGVVIGFFQAHYAEFEDYQSPDGEERIKIKGGWTYLIGWIAIFIIQLIINIYFVHEKIGTNDIMKEVIHTVVEDLLPFSKIGSKNLWTFWALSGGSSMAYTAMLALRSTKFRNTIKRGARKAERKQKDLY